MDANMVTEISTGLTGYGNAILENLVDLLPALAAVAAVFFVIRLIRRKVRA